MVDPYRMIVVNVISSLSLLSIVLILKLLFHKKINYLFLLIVISLLPILSLLRNGAYESGDFTIHVYRSMTFYKSLQEGILMPSWAGDLNAEYGYPLFILNYTLPYYVISLFHFFGITFITSTKILLGLSYSFSGIFMFFFSKKLFKNDIAAFTSSVFYLFAPYHLIATHFKITVGELLVFTFLPLAFLSFLIFYTKRHFINSLVSAGCLALVILSHVVLGFFTCIIIGIYSYANNQIKNKKELYLFTVLFSSAGLLSIYNWISPFIYKKYSYFQIVPLENMYFPTLPDLLYSPWRFGFLFQGPHGEISNLIGYSHILILLLSIYIVLKYKNRKINQSFRFFLITSIVIIFLITGYSKFIWNAIPFIKAAGSHRLLILLSFTISILSGYIALFYSKTKKQKIILCFLICFTIGSTILNWGHRRVISAINDQSLEKNLPLSTSQGEGHYYANSKWIDLSHPWFSKIPKSHLQTSEDNSLITNLSRTSTVHEYLVKIPEDTLFEESTLYYPGWQLSANNKDVPIHPNKKGIIEFSLPAGTYDLTLKYQDISPYYEIKKITLISWFVFVGIVILDLMRKKLIWKKG